MQNFENQNPANTLWTKQYNLYSKIDTEAPRYLGFERWWPTARAGQFALRSGMSLGEGTRTWSWGLGWRAQGARLDYARVQSGVVDARDAFTASRLDRRLGGEALAA